MGGEIPAGAELGTWITSFGRAEKQVVVERVELAARHVGVVVAIPRDVEELVGIARLARAVAPEVALRVEALRSNVALALEVPVRVEKRVVPQVGQDGLRRHAGEAAQRSL